MKFITKKMLPILLIISMLVTGMISIPTSGSNETSKPLDLINDNKLNLSISINADENQLIWNVKYEKKTDFDTRLSLKLLEEVVVEAQEEWESLEDGWIREKSDISSSSLSLHTDLITESITLEVKLETQTYLETEIDEYLSFKINRNDFISDDHQTEDEIINEDIETDDEIINDIIETEDETIIVIDDPSKLQAVTDEILNLSNANIDNYTDPFKYTKDNKGTVPTHGTENFNVGNSDSKTTRNYNYAGNSGFQGEPTVVSAYGDSNQFLNGYHYYPNLDSKGDPKPGTGVLTKKTVKPTNDPTKFDMEVDIIGGATPIKNKIDVMLIIDKSTSMNQRPNGLPAYWSKSRWDLLKVAVGGLADKLLTNQNDIQIGMTSFGSYWSGSATAYTWTEVANFGNSTNPLSFTKNSELIKRNKLLTESMLDGGNIRDGSGTPTFLGIQSGMEVTKADSRDGAIKFVILITDGVSTFGPGNNFTGLSSRTRLIPSTGTNGVFTYQFSNTTGNIQYTGSGSETPSGTQTKISEITDQTLKQFLSLKNNPVYKDFRYMSLGLATTNEAYPPNIEDPAKQMNKLLNEFQSHGRFNGTTDQGITSAFEEIKRVISGYDGVFILGQLIDPMSENVSLVENSLHTSALSLNVNDKNQPIDLISIPVIDQAGNKNPNAPQYSIDINVEYPLEENGNKFHLSNMNLGSVGLNRMGYRLNYTVQVKEDKRDGQFYSTNGPTRAVAFNYSHAIGFAVPSVRVPTRDFEFTKVGQEGRVLPGAKFELHRDGKILATVESNQKGKVIIPNLTAGSYQLVETKAPDGYQKIEPLSFEITQGPPTHNGELNIRIDEKYVDGTIIVIENKLKPFTLRVTKEDEFGKALKGAVFRLNGIDYDISISDLKSNIFEFKGLKPGTYTLHETTTPDGYVKMNDVSIVINSDGSVKVNDSIYDGVLGRDDNIIYYTVVNYQKGILPATGSKGMMIYILVATMLIFLSFIIWLYSIYRNWRCQ